MPRSALLSNLLLLPASKIYGMVVAVRNKLFDMGLMKEHSFDVPVIVVGNISMGGTGKTPHTEYLIEALRDDYRLGVLSRGYKRRTKGFVLATKRSRPEDIGDEPYQMFNKYGGEVTVAVCESRVEGIKRMLEINPEIQLFLLDDAFQHRYVKPDVSIVLTEFGHPVFYDHLLPYGRLREPMSALNRCDAVIVTKCPDDAKPVDFRIFRQNLDLYPYQKLLFSTYSYGHLVSVFPEAVTYIPYLDWLTNQDSILIVTGVGNPRPFVRHLRKYKATVKVRRFADHHNFSSSDMESLLKTFNEMPGKHKYVITTEKDAVRLSNNPYFPYALKSAVFYLPIRVDFLSQSDGDFDQIVKGMIKNVIKTKLQNKNS